jgi:hypothetical protein
MRAARRTVMFLAMMHSSRSGLKTWHIHAFG